MPTSAWVHRHTVGASERRGDNRQGDSRQADSATGRQSVSRGTADPAAERRTPAVPGYRSSARPPGRGLRHVAVRSTPPSPRHGQGYIDPVQNIGWTTKLLPGFASGVVLVTVAVISSSVRAVPTV